MRIFPDVTDILKVRLGFHYLHLRSLFLLDFYKNFQIEVYRTRAALTPVDIILQIDLSIDKCVYTAIPLPISLSRLMECSV